MSQSSNGNGSNGNGDGRRVERQRFMPHTIARDLIGSGMYFPKDPDDCVRAVFTAALRAVATCSEQELLDLVIVGNCNGTPVGEILLAVSDGQPVGGRMRAHELVFKIAAAVVTEVVYFLLAERDGRRGDGKGEEQRPKLAAMAGGKAS